VLQSNREGKRGSCLVGDFVELGWVQEPLNAIVAENIILGVLLFIVVLLSAVFGFTLSALLKKSKTELEKMSNYENQAYARVDADTKEARKYLAETNAQLSKEYSIKLKKMTEQIEALDTYIGKLDHQTTFLEVQLKKLENNTETENKEE